MNSVTTNLPISLPLSQRSTVGQKRRRELIEENRSALVSEHSPTSRERSTDGRGADVEVAGREEGAVRPTAGARGLGERARPKRDLPRRMVRGRLDGDRGRLGVAGGLAALLRRAALSALRVRRSHG